ncbi:hypothetical protein AU468_06185 [Alkalispirochaeta sphaeroplastigenens]|uniref:Fibronectin type-III domain-containing protein n=1 Tax=Alkalispirochaeta sphaeroplastigenens TaxID=1187066 RepID=A0A2S4JSX3_9SPIO|nr:leucine-rich repeat protein [Alkalispirochaeta sphaeroplastigenens]POR02637.1 hypothetical protein AU468_06185 [Alkalispirochaeta sphaeroplastigenens]
MLNLRKSARLGLIVPLIFLASCFLASCSLLLSPFEKSDRDRTTASHPGADHTGALEIIFNQTRMSTVLPPEVSPADLEFDLTLNPVDIPGQEEIDLTGLSESELFVPELFPGTWSVSLRGYFPEGTPLEGVTPEVDAFGATENIDILPGIPTTWEAQLEAIRSDDGVGSVKIELSWDDSDLVTEWLDDDDTLAPSPSLQRLNPGQTHEEPVHIIPERITFNVDERTLIYEESGLQSGFYRIAITLLRDDTTVATYRDVIHIYDGRRSEKELDITELIGTPPLAPENLQVSPVSFADPDWTVELSWTRSVTAEGYRVYRRADGGDFEIISGTDPLPRATKTFLTTQSSNEGPYVYRLVAWNNYGDAPPLDSDEVPGDLQGTDGTFTFHIHSDYLILAGYMGSDPAEPVVIPAEAEVQGSTRPVKIIADQAFMDDGIFGTLTIPESITEIGNEAFTGNAFTGDLIIPDSVTSIGEDAFNNAGFNGGTLTLETETSNLQTIGGGAFRSTSFTGDLTIPNSVTSIGEDAFNNAGFNEGTLTLGTENSNLQTIGNGAFWSTSFTGNLTIPNSVTSIGEDAFRSAGFNGSLTLGTENSNLEIIGGRAFLSSTFAGGLTIPDSVTEIGVMAFRYGNFEGDLTIPDSVISIGNNAFEAFSKAGYTAGTLTLGGLESSNLQTIGNSAFLTNNFAGDLTIPNSVEEIGSRAFKESFATGSTRTLTLGDPQNSNLRTIGAEAFSENYFGQEITLPEGLEKIGVPEVFSNGGAFENNRFSGHLVIPDSVTIIGNGSFRNNNFGVNGTDTLTLGDPETSNLVTIGAHAFRENQFRGNLVIPNKVEVIGESAFQGEHNEKPFVQGSLTLGSSLVEIGASAFHTASFSHQSALVIPDSVTTIGAQAFYNTNLGGASLSLGDPQNSNLVTIGAEAFNLLTGGSFTGNLVIPNSVEVIGDGAFQESFDGADGTLTLGTGLRIIERGAFKSNRFTGPLTLPEGLEIIGGQINVLANGAFYSNAFTGDLVIPDSVTEIQFAAFQEAGFDGTLTISNSVTEISVRAFQDTGFTGDLTIPDSVTSVRDRAFENTRFDGELILGNGLTNIGISAFEGIATGGNQGFTSLTIPASPPGGDGTMMIRATAFRNSSIQITEITIPDWVTSIGNNAFTGWTALTTVTVNRWDAPDGITTAGTTIFGDAAETSVTTIRVPAGSLDAYKAATGWSDYEDKIEVQ